jgi:hypothetical protein
MTLRAHSLAGQRVRGLLSIASLVGVTVLILPSGCSKPTCDETLTCPYEEPDPDAGKPRHDAGDLPQADASDDVAETDAASEAGDAGGGSDADAATLGPRIVSTSPAAGAKGVRADANIVVTFDRPMDKAKTSQAYQSTDIPLSTAVLTWNSDGTQLTINPNADLTYASGVVTATPDAIAARKYAFRVTTAARDLAGNTLQQEAAVSFTTLRRLAHGVVAKGDAVINFRRTEVYATCGTASNAGFTALRYKGPYIHVLLVTFDISPFPRDVVSFEAASVGSNQIGVYQDSYNHGVVVIDHVREPFPIGTPHTATTSTPIRSLGVFSSDAKLEYKAVNALDALKDDFAARRQYAQFRLDNTFSFSDLFSTGYAEFDCSNFGFHLSAVYLVP